MKKHKHNVTRVATIGIVALLIVGLMQLGKKSEKTLKIGMATTLTGRLATAGVQSRNGVTLGIEEINDNGGVNGRQLDLVVKDDKADVLEAQAVVNQLIDENVIAVLGHYISSCTTATVPIMNKRNRLMLGVGSITAAVSKLDDNYIRILTPVDKRAPYLARLAYEYMKIRKIFIIYDGSNPKYVNSQRKVFRTAYQKLNGQIIHEISFDAGEKYSAPDLVSAVHESESDGLFVVANAVNASLICQHLRKIGSQIPVVGVEWNFTDPDFIKNGGNAVEGVVSLSHFSVDFNNEKFAAFWDKYEKRFGTAPSSFALLGYEGAYILADALEKNSNPETLKKTILGQRVYQGVDSQIIIDEYGDPYRTLYIHKIENGKIKTVKKYSAEEVMNYGQKLGF